MVETNGHIIFFYSVSANSKKNLATIKPVDFNTSHKLTKAFHVEISVIENV